MKEYTDLMVLSASHFSPHSAKRLQAIQEPIIPQVAALIAANPGTISLGQGMVSYGPPTESQQQLVDFWSDPSSHRYDAVLGLPQLIDACSVKLRSENGMAVGAESRVLVTAGSNMGFLQTILAITDPGDDVVLFAPYYFNHQMALGIAGCRAVVVPCTEAYQPDLAALKEAIGPRTRAVVTVSPNNPTGAVYSQEMLHDVNQLCRHAALWHISDEAYEYFVYDGAEHCSPGGFPGAAPHTISLFSLSKAYGFAGWRIGYSVIPASLASALLKIQDTNLICPPIISQRAALGALKAGRSYCESRLAELAPTRARLLRALEGLGRYCKRPLVADGAMYVLLEFDTSMSGRQLNNRLIEEHRVAALPGETFGIEDRCALRVSYGALDEQTAAQGIDRLVGGLAKILGR